MRLTLIDVVAVNQNRGACLGNIAARGVIC